MYHYSESYSLLFWGSVIFYTHSRSSWIFCPRVGLTRHIRSTLSYRWLVASFPKMASVDRPSSSLSSILYSTFHLLARNNVSTITSSCVCPNQFLLLHIRKTLLFYLTLPGTSAFINPSFQEILTILLHILNAYNFLSSFFLNFQVSAPYRSCLLYTSRCV